VTFVKQVLEDIERRKKNRKKNEQVKQRAQLKYEAEVLRKKNGVDEITESGRIDMNK